MILALFYLNICRNLKIIVGKGGEQWIFPNIWSRVSHCLLRCAVTSECVLDLDSEPSFGTGLSSSSEPRLTPTYTTGQQSLINSLDTLSQIMSPICVALSIPRQNKSLLSYSVTAIVAKTCKFSTVK